MKSAILLEEFSRIGGGQNVAKTIMNVMRDEFTFDLVTDKVHGELDAPLFNRIIETRYLYYNNISYPKLLSGIIKLTLDINQNKGYIASHDVSINNHPNIFLLNATINIIHEPFLNTNLIDGGPTKEIIKKLIRISGVYSIYSDAIFVLAGNYIKKKITNECEYLKIKPRLITIHYPVEYPEYVDFHRKKKYVLTFGRISSDKDLETVLKIASRSNTTFVIAGAVNYGSADYVKELTLLKPGNVIIIANPSDEKKRELLTEATVYLHTKHFESYGLSVAEGVGFGCVPVVPKDGGPWEDIVECGKYGYGYLTPEEASKIIDKIINEDISKYKYIYDSRERFSINQFKSSFLEVVDSIIK